MLRLLLILKLFAVMFTGSLILSGCASFTERQSPGPDEGTPRAPASFLHSGNGTNAPAGSSLEGWWRVYQDPVLDCLIQQLEDANPDVEAALARVDQSYAVLGIARGPLLPTVMGDLSARRVRDSVNDLLFPIDSPEYSRYRMGASASWELDLWGRVRGAVKRDRLRAEAEGLTFRDVLLSLQADLARQYFAFRSAQEEAEILRDAVQLRRENLELQESRVELGAGVEVDAALARLELHNAVATAEVTVRRLEKLRHALAALVGVAPAEFMVDFTHPGRASKRVPQVPEGVPSVLLERRTDLRAADRNLQAAAIQIGVKKSDFLPKITINGAAGVASLKTSNLFDSGSGFYDVGPQVDVPIFQSGARKWAVAQARAEWREAVANYRGALLTAVREVDDALLELKSLDRESTSRRQAVKAATQAAHAAKDRYASGLASYFEFIDAERERLQGRLEENALRGAQWAAGVSLIQALGGGW
jgi:multidrug efflux system outer membrane protein